MNDDLLEEERRLRVPLVLGIALVLLCGAIGILIGSILPADSFLQP